MLSMRGVHSLSSEILLSGSRQILFVTVDTDATGVPKGPKGPECDGRIEFRAKSLACGQKRRRQADEALAKEIVAIFLWVAKIGSEMDSGEGWSFQVGGLAIAVEDGADPGAEESGRSAEGNHDELEGPEVVIGRIGDAVGDDEAGIGDRESDEYGEGNRAFFAFDVERKKQPGEEGKGEKAVPGQNFGAMLTGTVRLKLPEEDQVEANTGKECCGKAPLPRKHLCSPESERSRAGASRYTEFSAAD